MKKSIKFKRFVFIETPYDGRTKKNIEYARACVRDSLERGESPFSSDLLYAQEGILDYKNSKERRLGTEAGTAWARNVRAVHIVYVDLGLTKEMHERVHRAREEGRRVEYMGLEERRVKKSRY